MKDAVIVKLDGATRMLAEAKTMQQAKQIMDMADAAKVYAKRQKLGEEAVGYANSIKIEAMRRLGEIWAEAPKNKGANGRKFTGTKLVPVKDTTPTLLELGINKKVASVSQRLAKLPKREFEQVRDGIVGMAEALSAAKRNKMREQVASVYGPHAQGRFFSDLAKFKTSKYGCIYVDPPWRYSNQGTRGATDNHYETMSVDELCKMPVGDLAADRCHLHLWVTNGFLFEAPKIFEAWGFEFKSSFVWVKPQMGMGNYWRNSHEILLLGVRGGLTAGNRGLMSWVKANRREHSQKPDCVRDFVTKLSPGPYLELFGRQQVAGWDVFGNQILEKAA